MDDTVKCKWPILGSYDTGLMSYLAGFRLLRIKLRFGHRNLFDVGMAVTVVTRT